LAEGQAYCEVADLVISPDNRLMAYAVDFQGRRMYTVRFVELGTGKLLPDTIPGTAGEMAWAADSRTVFFIHQDEETLRNTELRRHRLGEGNKQATVWFEPDEAFDLTLDATKSERYIVCTAFSKTTTEVRYLRSDDPDGPCGYSCRAMPAMSTKWTTWAHIGGYAATAMRPTSTYCDAQKRTPAPKHGKPFRHTTPMYWLKTWNCSTAGWL
jgi:protease II